MWSPALAGFVHGANVRVRLRDELFGRAVVEAPDGSLIWPAGRLREGPGLTRDGRAPKVDAWPESGTFSRPGLSTWALAFMLVVPFLVIIGTGLADLSDMSAFAFAAYGFLFFLWGMSGGLMARVPWDTP